MKITWPKGMLNLRAKLMKWLAGNDIAMIVNVDINGTVKAKKPVSLYLHGTITPVSEICSTCLAHIGRR